MSYADDCFHGNETLTGNHAYLALFPRRLRKWSNDVTTWTVQVDAGRRVNFTWLLPPSSVRRRWRPDFSGDVTLEPRLITFKFLESGRAQSVYHVELSNCSSVTRPPSHSSDTLYVSDSRKVTVELSATDWSHWNSPSTTSSTLSRKALTSSLTSRSCPLIIQYQGLFIC